MLKSGNQNKTTLSAEERKRREDHRQKLAEADAKRELNRRRLNKSTGQPMSGLVDTDETEVEE